VGIVRLHVCFLKHKSHSRTLDAVSRRGKVTVMSTTLDTMTTDGRVVISFPEAAVPPREREEFLSFLKAEWAARQSKFTAADAESLAAEVDAAWWSRNRERILNSIGGA
jgi:hypothetical protein